ncbi:hypothetical protein A2768_01520 [Candidatus Roizmanbacteria bacterium RIFCSPHIGHO2_01_FULL_37_16]|nr:MAG: hypothetical protein A2768_01520 [Candidatus Roizmanbacteria bacterium RIFCSPHIGHO2_01_FULL_37_16]
MQKIKLFWQQYDELSNKELDWFIHFLEAIRQGNVSLANYIEKNVLTKLVKESYKAFLLYMQEFEKLDKNKNGR